MRRLLNRPSPALVVACSALLVALTGTAIAAEGLITGKQVKDGTLTGADVRNGSLTAADLSTAAVRSLQSPSVGVAATGSLTPPPTLVNHLASPSLGTAAADASLTTPRDGQLLLAKSFAAELVCNVAGAYVWWWLTLDGTPVRSTLTLGYATRADLQPISLAGVTEGVIPAGRHVLGIGAMCSASEPIRPVVLAGSGGSAVVLG